MGASGSGKGGHAIEDEGIPLPDKEVLNFVGSNVTVTTIGDKTVVTITSGGGSAHNILSATHSDSIASVIARGGLMVGDSTPLWAQLVLGATGTYLRSNGSDLLYSALLLADLPNLPVLGTNPASPRQTAIVDSEISTHESTKITGLPIQTKLLDMGGFDIIEIGNNLNALAGLTIKTTGSNDMIFIRNLTTLMTLTGSGLLMNSEINAGGLQVTNLDFIRTKRTPRASLGFVRMANLDKLSWRDFGNSVNLDLLVNASDVLTFNAIKVLLANNVLNVDLPIGSAYQRKRTNASATALEDFTEKVAIPFVIGDNTNVISTGIKLVMRVEFDMEITRWSLMANESGSIVIDINRYTSLANYDSGTKASITGSDTPDLVADKSDDSTALTGWTVILNEGDILECEIDSITTIKRITLSLRGTKRG